MFLETSSAYWRRNYEPKRQEYKVPGAPSTTFTRYWTHNEKKEKWSPNHNGLHFSSYFYIGQEPPGDLMLWEVLDITTCSMPHSNNIPFRLQCFLGKMWASNTLILSLSLILTMLWLPLFPLALCCLLPSSVLFSVWQLSGPNWPRLISVSYGSWRVRPSPLNTDWLAGLISSLRTLCSLPSSARCCAVRARPDREECG